MFWWLQDSEAQYILGMCYESGYGVEENPCRAADLYAKSADSGHPDATYSLAIFHRDGFGGIDLRFLLYPHASKRFGRLKSF